MASLRSRSDTPAFWALLGVQSGRLAFDIGANGGTVATMFAPNFEKVVAFEPGDSFDDLNASAPMNVICVNAAVSDVMGTVTLRQADRAMRTGQLVTGDSLEWGSTVGYVDVESLTLDQAMGMYGQPDLIKIDVEGHELRVLLGGARTLSKRPKLMIEVHKLGYALKIWQLLKSAGYRRPTVVRHELHPRGSVASLQHFYLVAQ